MYKNKPKNLSNWSLSVANRTDSWFVVMHKTQRWASSVSTIPCTSVWLAQWAVSGPRTIVCSGLMLQNILNLLKLIFDFASFKFTLIFIVESFVIFLHSRPSGVFVVHTTHLTFIQRFSHSSFSVNIFHWFQFLVYPSQLKLQAPVVSGV